jgi:hypothetical protein
VKDKAALFSLPRIGALALYTFYKRVLQQISRKIL